MNKVAAFALRRKNSILSMSEKRFCPPQPLRFWITPAYAGKSCAEQARRFHLRDHPPRMRGKGASGIVCDFVHGITPTCAGKSPAIMVCSLEYWGSPPRVWGKVQPERDVQDAAIFAGAEDQQCRRTAGTSSGGNGTLSCYGRFHQGSRSKADGNCRAENPYHQLCQDP